MEEASYALTHIARDAEARFGDLALRLKSLPAELDAERTGITSDLQHGGCATCSWSKPYTNA